MSQDKVSADRVSGSSIHSGETTAGVVARTLAASGIDHLFLMTGGDLSLWQAIRGAGIRLVLCRSEAGSVAMADAYARLTGRPAAVYGQWGPGAANVAGALADAAWARSPVLALTSTVPTTTEYRNEYQELDQPPMFSSVTKWQARINRPDRAADVLNQAVHIAQAGSPGPVHVDIPSDVLKMPVSEGSERAPAGPILRQHVPSQEAIAQVARLLSQSSRPVLLAGQGVLLGHGEAALKAFAEAALVPVVTTMGGKGAIAETHSLSLGVAGRYSRKSANEILAKADFVLVLGSDLGGLATDTYRLPRPGTQIVQVDLVEEQIGRTVPVTLGVVADAGSVCAQMITATIDRTERKQAWRLEVAAVRARWHEEFVRVASEPAQGHVRPEAIVAIMAELLADDDIVVADTGFMGAWGGALYPVPKAGRYFLRAAGTLGWAFPAVLGAQLAAGSARRAVALIGDGGFGYHAGDLETAVRLGIPAITIVMNNSSLAYEHIGYMQNLKGDVVTEVCDFSDVDFASVAESFGATGYRVSSADHFKTALASAIAARVPSLIDVRVSKNRFAPVTTFDRRTVRDL